MKSYQGYYNHLNVGEVTSAASPNNIVINTASPSMNARGGGKGDNSDEDDGGGVRGEMKKKSMKIQQRFVLLLLFEL